MQLWALRETVRLHRLTNHAVRLDNVDFYANGWFRAKILTQKWHHHLLLPWARHYTRKHIHTADRVQPYQKRTTDRREHNKKPQSVLVPMSFGDMNATVSMISLRQQRRHANQKKKLKMYPNSCAAVRTQTDNVIAIMILSHWSSWKWCDMCARAWLRALYKLYTTGVICGAYDSECDGNISANMEKPVMLDNQVNCSLYTSTTKVLEIRALSQCAVLRCSTEAVEEERWVAGRGDDATAWIDTHKGRHI